MLNTIQFYLKKDKLSNSQTDNKDIINISKTIQSNLDKNILLLFQKEAFSKIDVDNYSDSDSVSEDTEDYSSFKSNSIYSDSESEIESDSESEIESDSESEIESDSESDYDIKIIKDIIHESNSEKKIGSNNKSSISYQYDISDLVNAIK